MSQRAPGGSTKTIQVSEKVVKSGPRAAVRKALAMFASAVALIALTSFSQSYALSLGEVAVRSALGQPLDAVVRVSAAPGETLRADCFSVVPPADSGLPAIGNVRLTLSPELSPGTLRIRGRAPMREPMSEMVLRVDCPGLPQLTRTFVVLVDPPSEVTEMARAHAAQSATAAPLAAAPVATPRPAPAATTARVEVRPRLVLPNEPILPGERYVVQRGDALSLIAARVRGRPEFSVWPLAQRIFEANPDAFENGNPDALRVGATLRIPGVEPALLAGAARAALALRAGTRPASRPATVAALPERPAPRPEPAREIAKPAPAPAPRALAVGALPQPLPTMMLSRSLSPLSVDRLRLRRSGRLQVATPTALDAPPPPDAPSEPQPAVTVAPSQPVPVQREVQVITKPRFWLWDWLILAAGFVAGALVMVFGLRRWVRKERAAQEREMLRARRHQERLDESRRQRSTTAAPAIVVQESPQPQAARDDDTEQPAAPVSAVASNATVPVADAAGIEIDDAPHSDIEPEAPAPSDAPAELTPSSLAVDDLSVDDGLDFDVFHTPDESDLALLEQSYTQTTDDVRTLEPSGADAAGRDDEPTAMIDPGELGLNKDATHIMHSSLDLELPQDDGDDEAHIELPNARGDDPDMTQAGLELDANLLELDYDLDTDPTMDALPAADTAPSDSPTSSIDTRSDEDYYHLEASSIRHVGSLAFEDDGDDESKILAFRKPAKTGTDDDGAR